MGCIQSKSIEYPETSVHGIPYAIECKETRISKDIVLWNQFMVIRFLGSGASGQVFLCMDIHTHGLVAVKCLPGNGARVPMEAQHLQTLKSAANIVPLQGILYDIRSSQTMIIMEYYAGGSIFDRNQMKLRYPVPEDVARWYIRDIARGVMALHARGIIHGDLKLENALLSCKGSIGLIDLGSSKEYAGKSDTITSRKGGTPVFQAPEILLEKGPYSGKAADVYALGTCLYILLFSKTPYEAESISDLLCLVRQNRLRIPDHPQVSTEAVSLIRGLLDHDPQKRMTLKELSVNEWITDNGRLRPVCIEQQATYEEEEEEEECTFDKIFAQEKQENLGTLYAKGERICMQGECSNGSIGIVLEGKCDIVCRGTAVDDISQPSWGGDLHSNDDADWVHITSHGSSTSSSSAYDAQREENKKKNIRNLEKEIDKALERLEQLRFRSPMRGFQEEYIVERDARILGEAVFQTSIVPASSHEYSAIAARGKTRVLWIPPEVLYSSMSSNSCLHQTISLLRCQRRSMLDTISGLCLVRDMII